MNTNLTNRISDLNRALFFFDVGLSEDADEKCQPADFKKAVADTTSSLKSFISRNNKTTVAIIVDDYTRSTPTAEILSYLMPVHGKEMLDFGVFTNSEMENALETGDIKDPMSAIEVLHNNVVCEKAKLFLHSPDITKEEAEKMNFEYVEDLNNLLKAAKIKEKLLNDYALQLLLFHIKSSSFCFNITTYFYEKPIDTNN